MKADLNWKLCTGPEHAGPRWMRGVYFHVKKWDADKRRPMQLQSRCKACQRGEARVNRAWDRGKPEPYKQRGPAMSAEERKKRKWQTERKRRQRPEVRAKVNEHSRNYQERKRRAAGVPVRGPRGPRIKETKVKLPSAPFLEWWLDEGRKEREWKDLPESVKNLVHQAKTQKTIQLTSVDEALVFLRREEMLTILYPTDPQSER